MTDEGVIRTSVGVDLSAEDVYTHFIDNRLAHGHRSVIFGLRELNTTETVAFCSGVSSNATPPMPERPFQFTSNYGVRVYTSGCYYLDSSDRWRSDGVLVGPSTNHQSTECLSTHLTTFAGGFLVLPTPINWNYVFANAQFTRNKTIYITVICGAVLYLVLVAFARYKDKQDVRKVSARTSVSRDDETSCIVVGRDGVA